MSGPVRSDTSFDGRVLRRTKELLSRDARDSRMHEYALSNRNNSATPTHLQLAPNSRKSDGKGVSGLTAPVNVYARRKW
jgi:hypothetical protein